MSDNSPKNTSSALSKEELMLDLNFVPQWARKEPGANHYQAVETTERRPARRGPPREGGAGRRPPSSGDRRPPQHRPRDVSREPRRPPRAPRVELPIDIKFLPEQKMLASVVRQVHHSKRAYPLMDLAHIFLSDARGHMVKLEVHPRERGFKLYRGKKTQMVATNPEVLLRQILENHLCDFFTKEEIEVEPPNGAFPVIGRIGDTIVGPPNHHSYATRIVELQRSHYPQLSVDQLKERIETVRDEALVEQWKQESSKKTVYRLIDQPEGKEYSLMQAEELMRTRLADSEIEEVTRAVIPSSLARKITDENLIRMIREAWQKESIFPINLSFALRAAFRHLHLYLFKAGKNINFVMHIKPDPLPPETAVENIRVVLEYLTAHPGSTRKQMVEALIPDDLDDEAKVHELQKPIHWLVEKGHLIEFFNGTLSVPGSVSRRK